MKNSFILIGYFGRRQLDLMAWGLKETPEVRRWLSAHDLTLEALQDVSQELSDGGLRGMNVHKGGNKETEATDERLAAKKAPALKQPKKKAKITKKGTDDVATDEEDDPEKRKNVIKDLPAEKMTCSLRSMATVCRSSRSMSTCA